MNQIQRDICQSLFRTQGKARAEAYLRSLGATPADLRTADAPAAPPKRRSAIVRSQPRYAQRSPIDYGRVDTLQQQTAYRLRCYQTQRSEREFRAQLDAYDERQQRYFARHGKEVDRG